MEARGTWGGMVVMMWKEDDLGILAIDSHDESIDESLRCCCCVVVVGSRCCDVVVQGVTVLLSLSCRLSSIVYRHECILFVYSNAEYRVQCHVEIKIKCNVRKNKTRAKERSRLS